MPALVVNDLVAFAFLISGKVNTKFAVEYFSEHEKTKWVKQFVNLEDAHKWLDEMSK